MLLSELRDVKTLQQLPAEELMAELMKRGILKREMGRGLTGVAFELKNGDIMKVWVSDPGYESWIEFARKHPNPAFVKVLSPIRTFKTGDHVLKYVRLEKLYPFKGATYDGLDVRVCMQGIGGHLNDVRYPPFPSAKEIWAEEFASDKPPIKITDKWTKLTNAIILIAEQLLSSGLQLDLHNGNFGRRLGSPDPVIFDPLHADPKYFDEVVELEKVLKNE